LSSESSGGKTKNQGQIYKEKKSNGVARTDKTNSYGRTKKATGALA